MNTSKKTFFFHFIQKQPRMCSVKEGVFKNFASFLGQHLYWSLFLIKLQSFRPATLLKTDSNKGASFEFFKSTYFEELLQTTTSVFFLKPTIVNINIKTTLFRETDLKNKLIINQHFQELVEIASNWKRLLCMRYNGSSSQTRVTTISPVQTVWWKKFSISMICVNDIYQWYMIWSVICVCLTCEIKTTI